MNDLLSIRSSWLSASEDFDEVKDTSDPWTMNIVLHLENDTPVFHEHALVAAAQGVVRYLTNPDFYNNIDIRQANIEWLQRRIRKVVRRARGSRWDAVQSVPGITVSFKSAELRVTVPQNAALITPAVKRLQVSGLDLPHAQESVSDLSNDTHLALEVIANEMTTGKQMAQVGHAAQYALLRGDSQWVDDWAMSSYAVSLASHVPVSTPVVTVVDAGLTEVAENTTTVLGHMVTS